MCDPEPEYTPYRHMQTVNPATRTSTSAQCSSLCFGNGLCKVITEYVAFIQQNIHQVQCTPSREPQ